MIRKKKKKKDKEKYLEANIRRDDCNTTEQKTCVSKTKAELKFEERKRKMEAERILKKASKTHKEKVEEFNRHLDSLTEHFDIPKVSWTK
ncbi:protein FAM32A-like isoform X2 [Oratosquilla oratoria]|uniref:protein FAM32A-like isoform X2 n=1 Tax=Oratosquilla oratoria TaxID=337810 RepID=UPI003F76D007